MFGVFYKFFFFNKMRPYHFGPPFNAAMQNKVPMGILYPFSLFQRHAISFIFFV